MDSLIIVKPETVIDWQRRRFKKYWTNKSVKRKRLGYNKNYISQRTISRYLKKIRPDVPDNTKKKRQQWKAFLKNYFLFIRCQLLCPVGVNYLGRFFNLNKCFLSA